VSLEGGHLRDKFDVVQTNIMELQIGRNLCVVLSVNIYLHRMHKPVLLCCLIYTLTCGFRDFQHIFTYEMLIIPKCRKEAYGKPSDF